MDITKKILGVIGVTMLLLLTTCNKGSGSVKNDIPGKQKNSPEIIESDFEYKLSEKTVFNDEVSCERLVDRYKDGFAFTGSASYTSTEFLVLSGNSGGQTETGSFNPDTAETDVISVKKKDNIIYFLCGSAGKGTTGSIISFDQNGSQIDKTDLDFCPNDLEVRDKIYVLDNYSSKVNVYSDKLVYENSIDVTYNSDGIHLEPYNIAVSSENEIYCLFSDKSDHSMTKVMSVGKKNKIICDSVDDMDHVNDIFTDSKGNIILMGKENGKYLVDEFDKTGNIIAMNEISNCDEVYGITGSDKIIFRSSEGISAFYNDKPELSLKSDDFNDNSIFACCMEADGCTAYLSSNIGDYNAVFITDQNNQIVSEIKADMIEDCFVQNDKVYVEGFFEEKHTLKIYDNGNITDTGIEFDDGRNSYRVGVMPSGEIIIYNGNQSNFTIYSDTFEKKSSNNTNISVTNFFKSNDSLYCNDGISIYRFNEKYETEKINLDISQAGTSMIISSGNDEYEFLYSMSRGAYGYNKSEKSATLLVDYNKEMLSDVQSVLMSNDKSILIQTLHGVFEAKKSDKKLSQESEKQKLALAYDDNSNSGLNTLKIAVKKYNDTSDKYIIEMKNYSSSENSSGSSLFNLDVVSGDIPDIVMSNLLSENIITYLKCDSLTDINQYIEKDSEINKDMFYSGVLDAFTYNDKLYSLPLIMSLNTGHTPGNTKFQNCSQLMDYINSTYSSGDYSLDYGVEDDIIQIYLSENMDLVNRKYNLSEMDFKNIISLIREFSPDLKGMNNEVPSENKMCTQFCISSLRYYYSHLQSQEQETDSQVSSELGYVETSGLICPQLSLSIMDKCENKDAAWDFIKTCCKCIGDNSSDELYSIKSLNTCSEVPSDIVEQFDSFMEGKFIDSTLYTQQSLMIHNEIYQNPDVSDDELSKTIYNKIKLYLSEIQ